MYNIYFQVKLFQSKTKNSFDKTPRDQAGNIMYQLNFSVGTKSDQ